MSRPFKTGMSLRRRVAALSSGWFITAVGRLCCSIPLIWQRGKENILLVVLVGV